ncbi:unnamed protein product [Cuscuta epithymum]|uniref:Trichome birefringence-like N-terminal domain-containing protein n=1 Tax=Cuscuta epithymum TaxID=186058 RepID=A0AAV0GG90_9ASTE|nr:unnamed protein product [Cuscuta epithymum]
MHPLSKKLKQPSSHFSFISPSSLFLCLLCVAALFFTFLLLKSSPSSPPNDSRINREPLFSPTCNVSHGRWIYDPTVKSARYDDTCKEIYKGWNCIGRNKNNAHDIFKWRWKPYECNLPQFNALQFLDRFRNTNIGFIGDSLNRNMFVSLFCTLKGVSGEVKKWHPAGADRGFTFLKYNLTIAYHRTNLLARYGGQPMPMLVYLNLLDTRRDSKLMLTYLKEHGQMLHSSMMFSSLTRDTGGGLLQSLTR